MLDALGLGLLLGAHTADIRIQDVGLLTYVYIALYFILYNIVVAWTITFVSHWIASVTIHGARSGMRPQCNDTLLPSLAPCVCVSQGVLWQNGSTVDRQ